MNEQRRKNKILTAISTKRETSSSRMKQTTRNSNGAVIAHPICDCCSKKPRSEPRFGTMNTQYRDDAVLLPTAAQLISDSFFYCTGEGDDFPVITKHRQPVSPSFCYTAPPNQYDDAITKPNIQSWDPGPSLRWQDEVTGVDGKAKNRNKNGNAVISASVRNRAPAIRPTAKRKTPPSNGSNHWDSNATATFVPKRKKKERLEPVTQDPGPVPTLPAKLQGKGSNGNREQKKTRIRYTDPKTSTAKKIDKSNDNDGSVVADQNFPTKETNATGSSPRELLPPWTMEQHRSFVMAIHEEGLRRSTPTILAELMTSLPKDFSREKLKSHLQKYRKNAERSRQEFLIEYDAFMKQMDIAENSVSNSLFYGQDMGSTKSATMARILGSIDPKLLKGGMAAAHLAYSASQNMGAENMFDDSIQEELPVLSEEEKNSNLGKAFLQVTGALEMMKDKILHSRASNQDNPTLNSRSSSSDLFSAQSARQSNTFQSLHWNPQPTQPHFQAPAPPYGHGQYTQSGPQSSTPSDLGNYCPHQRIQHSTIGGRMTLGRRTPVMSCQEARPTLQQELRKSPPPISDGTVPNNLDFETPLYGGLGLGHFDPSAFPSPPLSPGPSDASIGSWSIAGAFEVPIQDKNASRTEERGMNQA